MFHALHIKELGELEILDVYDYYDFPTLFSCKDATESLYIATLAKSLDNSDIWIYAKVSYNRLCLIQCGEISLYEAFYKPETGILIKATIPHGLDGSVESGNVFPNELGSDMFPSSENSLNFQGEMPMHTHEIDILRTSRTLGKEIINMKFKNNGTRNIEASIAVLGRNLIYIQNTVNAIEAANTDFKTNNKVIKDRMELSAIPFNPGSFIVSIVSKTTFIVDEVQPLLTLDSLQKRSISDFMNLIKSKSNEDMLSEILTRLKIKVVNNYKKFLISLKESKSDIEFSWASPTNNEKESATLSMFEIPAIIENLEQIEEEQQTPFYIVGQLVGLHVANKTFEMRSDENPFEVEDGTLQNKIIGSIPKEDPDTSVINATISRIYKAKIRPTFNKSIIIDENIKTDYILLKLEKIDTHL